MPSPIAHVAVGYAVCRWFRRRPPGPAARALRFADWRLALAAAFFSLLPDADAAVGFLLGDLGRYHNNLSHSLLMGVAAACLAAAAARVGRLGNPWKWFLFALACCELHVVMDFFTHGRGVMALWPCTARRFRSPVVFFYGLHWSEGLVSVRHIWTILSESVFGAALIWLVRRGPNASRRNTRKTARRTPAAGVEAGHPLDV